MSDRKLYKVACGWNRQNGLKDFHYLLAEHINPVFVISKMYHATLTTRFRLGKEQKIFDLWHGDRNSIIDQYENEIRAALGQDILIERDTWGLK